MSTRFITITVLIATLNPPCFAQGDSFRAGAATSNITPPLGEMIIGGWEPFPATHIHDDLNARCLVIDDGQTKLAIVICDILGLPREVCDSAKDQASKATGIPTTNMLIAATHTHSATTSRGPKGVMYPDTLTDYQRFLARRISDGIRRAANQLEPAKMASGSAREVSEVFNRRWYSTDPAHLKNPFGGDDKVRMNPPRGHAALTKPAGPIDPEISFISFQSTDGRPIALLANYSLHYVGGVPRGHVSADYFGYFCRSVTRKLGAEHQDIPFVAMLSNGTSGDINNINFRQKSPRRQPYEKMQEVADKVATQVYDSLGSLDHHGNVKLNARTVDIPLTLRKPTPKTMKHLRDVTSKEPPGKRRSKESIYLERLTKLQAGPDKIEAQLQVLQIGEIGIAAIPFETFVEIGLELKDRSPFKQTFTIELTNGWYGYLPTPQQHKLGGYETWIGTNFVQLDASEKIVKELLDMFGHLKKQR